MKTHVLIYNEQNNVIIDNDIKNLIRKSCRATLKFENFLKDAEIEVTLTDNMGIKELNSEFRSINKETDVLSFPLGENGNYDTNPENGALMLGNIVISTEKAKEQAENFGHSFEREISFLTVHSMLHLLGYDHVNNKSEEKIMFKKQEEILDKMGLSVKRG